MTDPHAALRHLARAGDDRPWPDGEGIVSDPGILGGEPVIAGTRFPALQAARLVATDGLDEALRWFPHLTEDQIRAACRYRQEHADRYEAEAWAGAFMYDPDGLAALQAAVGALLAERDALLAALEHEVRNPINVPRQEWEDEPLRLYLLHRYGLRVGISATPPPGAAATGGAGREGQNAGV